MTGDKTALLQADHQVGGVAHLEELVADGVVEDLAIGGARLEVGVSHWAGLAAGVLAACNDAAFLQTDTLWLWRLQAIVQVPNKVTVAHHEPL